MPQLCGYTRCNWFQQQKQEMLSSQRIAYLYYRPACYMYLQNYKIKDYFLDRYKVSE